MPRRPSVQIVNRRGTGRLLDYGLILAKLALDYADLELPDFAPPMGTERLREFIDERWGGEPRAPGRR